MAIAASGKTGDRPAGQSKGAHVYDALLAEIRKGTLRPGARVREEDIAARFDASRTPVREALARLQARGLIAISSGAGMAVATLTRQQVMELYAVRATLEGAAARFAAQNASTNDLSALHHVCKRFSDHDGDAAGLEKLNALFHGVIHQAAHNRYLARMLEDLTDSLLLLPDSTFSIAGRAKDAKGEHERILSAIEARYVDGAERAARDHIDKARDARLILLFDAE